MKVLVTGADGFIGRALCFDLRARGWQVVATARSVGALAAMGFDTLRADLTDTATHDAAFWRPHLRGGVAVIHAAGLLTGTGAAFRAVHIRALSALLQAREADTPAILLSAIGIEAETPFALWRRRAEAVAEAHHATILRAGLVLGETSYGGSSLIRALAALPYVLPVVGGGGQAMNPIHSRDLAAVMDELLRRDRPLPRGPLPNGAWAIGGPEAVAQTELAQAMRGWMGLPPARVWAVPDGLAQVAGRMGDALRLGPISSTALAQLKGGLLADAGPLLAQIDARPRGVSDFLRDRPAGTQDLWQARLYLLRPAIRIVLAVMWLASSALGLFLPLAAFAPHLPLPESAALILARAGGLVDLALGLALLRNWQPLRVAQAQIAVVLAYTLGLSLMAPHLWLDPFGGLLKNLPVLALLAGHLALVRER